MKKNINTFLVTGAAGFIGSEIAKRLLLEGNKVIGIDNLNNYYDTKLKRSRLFEIQKHNLKTSGEWSFHEISIENSYDLEKIGNLYSINIVVHMAAQAGVRNSIINPKDYVKSNLVGFFNILEFCRKNDIENFIFASSSSVYGLNKKVPFEETDNVDHQISFYGATKKSNEILAHSYSHLFKIPTTGLRFFTVYGPWGRPDMAPMIFIKSMINKQPIKIFNHGKMKRDFTFIDDIVEGVFRCCFKPATPPENMDSGAAPYRIFNIGNGKPIELLEFINILEKKLDLKVIKTFLPIQQGDVVETFADTKKLRKWINYCPQTNIEEGLDKFVEWYKAYN